MLFELAIACRDEPEAWRKKEGDVIAVKPHPWEWSKGEMGNHLIVIANFETKIDAERLTIPYYEGGVESFSLADSFGFSIHPPAIIEKRKFNLPLDILRNGWSPDLNLDRVIDISDAYQPFKDGKIIIDTSEKVAIFKDKHRGTFKYAARKVI